MILEIVTDPAAIDREKWVSFIFKHPDGNVFQTPEIYSIYAGTKRYEPILISCQEKEEIRGLMLAVIQKEYYGFLGRLTARAIVWGAPIIKGNDPEVLAVILKSYEQTLRSRAVYTQLRNLHDMEWAKNVLKKNGYIYEDHLNILIDLRKSEEELWKEINDTGRKKIKRAYRANIHVTLRDDMLALKKGYEILKEVYRNVRLPLPDFSMFLKAFESNNRKIFKNFVAMENGQIVGVRFVLCYNKTIYDWYAGSFQQSYKKYPNDLLPWEIFKWGKTNGYDVFDFGGAGKPGIPYGVRDYKMRFGGQLVNFGRFEKIHQPARMTLAKAGFKLWRLFRGRT